MHNLPCHLRATSWEQLTWPHTCNWFLTGGCQFFRFLPNYLEILSSFKLNARKQLGMYFQSGTQGSAVPYKFWPFGFMKNPCTFCQVKNSNLHVFCVNLDCGSELPWRFCVSWPCPVQGKQNFHYDTGWAWDKPCWVSLGAQTDRREPVSPIFSITSASGGLQLEEREISHLIQVLGIGTECARTLRWVGQHQRGEQDLLHRDNSTGINHLKRWNGDRLNKETWASKPEGKKKDSNKKMMEHRTELSLSFSAIHSIFGYQSIPNLYSALYCIWQCPAIVHCQNINISTQPIWKTKIYYFT